MRTQPTIPLTDDRGRPMLGGLDGDQPEPSSIVMDQGTHGTAWQRHFSDGLWHSTRGGRPLPWSAMLVKRNLVLIYDADAREEANDRG